MGVEVLDWQLSVLLYVLSFGGDCIDGYLARSCGQSSQFGGVLDMVTDRCSTAVLLMILSRMYTEHALLLQTLLMVDFASHWWHMMAAATIDGTHHKDVGENKNFLLRFYYGNKLFFGYCCIAAEFAYILAFVIWFDPEATLGVDSLRVHDIWKYAALPGCIFKQVINVAQLFSACEAIALEDVEAKSKDL